MKILLIPSCDINKKGSLKNTQTLERLEEGLKLWQDGDFNLIVTSGGIHSPNQTTASSVLMQIWLMNNKIESKKIISEQKSVDTFENIFFSMEKIREIDSCPEITVVTHWQHCLRFKATFWRKYGLKIKTDPIWRLISLKTFFLEWIFLLVHLVDRDGQNKISKKVRKNRTQ